MSIRATWMATSPRYRIQAPRSNPLVRPVMGNNLAERVKSQDMTAKLLAACLLVAVVANGQDNKPTFEADVMAVNLNGGLKAQLLSLARNPNGYAGRPLLAAAVKISNPGKDYAFVLFYDTASAIDDAGVNFTGGQGDAITGAEWCRMDPSERCFGIGNPALAVPPESYTVIDPGNSVTVLFRLITAVGASSRGKTVSLVAKYGYRLVKAADMEKDGDKSDAEKLRQVRRGSMSFPPAPVTER